MKKKKAKARNGGQPFKLAARLTIAEATELHRALLELLAAGEPIILDASQVQELDTAALQLLVSLWRTAASRGVAVAWQGVSEALRGMAALIGVAQYIELKDGAQPAHA